MSRDQCDCRVWRKALAPVRQAVFAAVAKARASAPIDGEHMKRVPASVIHDLGLALDILDDFGVDK